MALPAIPKKVIPNVVEIVDNIFRLAKVRPNISFFTFSCIKTVFDVLNRGSEIPEHNIKKIYMLKLFDTPKRQINPPKSNADIAINFSLSNSLKAQIKIPPNIVPNDHTNSLIAKALTLLLNLRFTNTGVKNAGADIKK